MVELNPHYISELNTGGALNQIVDGVDFPHTGLFKALQQIGTGNFVIRDNTNDFDITQSSSNPVVSVAAGSYFDNGEKKTASAQTFDNTDFTFTTSKAYYLIVIDSTGTIALRVPDGADKVAEHDLGDTIIAMIEIADDTTFGSRKVQYFTTDKTKNSLSIGQNNGGSSYIEEGKITAPTGASGQGIDIETVTTNSDIRITPNGNGKIVLDSLNWPTSDGAANQFLKTDGSNQLSFATVDLTSKQDVISGDTLTAATVATDDKVLIQDTDDADNLKTVTTQSIANLYNETDTLDSVVSKGDTTTRNISVGVATVDGLTNEGKTTIVPIDPTNANIDLGLANYGNTVYYIDGNAGPIMSLANGANGQIIHIKNSDTVNQVVINTSVPIDGAGAAEDKRRTSSTQITLLATEGITLQYVSDVTGIATGWYILDTDTNATSGISNVVEDTTPQLGGMLDVNGNSIGDGTNELLSFSETASAVNYLEITNAATTNDPKLSAAGSDTNIGIEIESKGTGLITLDGNVLMGEVVGTYGTAPRNLNLIGPDAVMRVARTSTLAYAPAMELIHLSSDGNTTNAYFDIFLETDKLQFRDRTTAGGAGQAAGIEILTLMEGTGKVGIQNPSPTADLDLVDGGTFRSTRLLTVNITADDTLTESEHAGRYCFVTGASRTITLGATTADVAAGIHYTLISNDANGFTLTSTKTMNGSSDDITVTARNAVTIIADGSNYVVLGA